MKFNFSNYFPETISNEIKKYLQEDDQLEEIRLRNSRPIILKTHIHEIITSYSINYEDIINVLQ